MFITVKLRTFLFCAVAAFLLFGITLRLCRNDAKPAMGAAEQGKAVYVLDAGHGGEDGGAVSANGTKESVINLSITQKLDALLHFLGRETVLTRTEDVSVYSKGAETLRQKKVSDLKNRVALVNGTPNAVLVSIHQNSLPSSPRVHGAQVFFGMAELSAVLARSVQSALNASVNFDGEKADKPIENTIYLMKNVTCPAILVECGFLSNEDETMRLLQPEHQKRIAFAIAAGLLNTEDKT